MSQFHERSLYDIYEMWRIGRIHGLALGRKQPPPEGVPSLVDWLKRVDMLTVGGLEGAEHSAVADAMLEIQERSASSGAKVDDSGFRIRSLQ